MEFAVITGASRGLGKSFAYQLAKLKINLILVSLARENLLSFGKELEAKNNTVKVIRNLLHNYSYPIIK
jgi:short-subunit dehydrogenase